MPTFNFKTSSGTDLGNLNLGWITKDYLMSVYPQIANQMITPELWISGGNSYGELGDNTTAAFKTAVTTFAGGANWKQVSCGNQHTAAIKTDGTLWTWGRNSYGRLGDNTSVNRSTPVTTFAGGTNWKQVYCGPDWVGAIKTDGTLWMWGRNYQMFVGAGNLGINNTELCRSTPVTTFAGGTNWKQIAGGNRFAAAIKTDGTLWMWGRNSYGQLGNNSTTQRLTPVTTSSGGTNWKQVAGGGSHTVAVKTDGTLWTWGRNTNGQLGNNSTTQSNNPVTTFLGGTNWKQVAGGYGHTAAIKTDGTLWTWGRNNSGNLGDNTTTQRLTPVTTFAGGTTWKQVNAASSFITSALKTDGTIWGMSGNTPAPSYTGITSWKQFSNGYGHTAGIRTSDDLQGI